MIGIYGGTFDPVHFGHLRTAIEVKEYFKLDELRLIPCSQPAHRELPLTPSEMRFEMLKLAVKNQPDLMIDRRELDRDGLSYMIDTLQSIKNEFPQTPLLLFIGTDAFEGLPFWHQWKSLFNYAHIVVMTRPGYKTPLLSGFLSDKCTKSADELFKKKQGCLFFQSVTQLDISASMIRELIKLGGNPGYLLPDSVIDFIEKQQLYKKINPAKK